MILRCALRIGKKTRQQHVRMLTRRAFRLGPLCYQLETTSQPTRHDTIP